MATLLEKLEHLADLEEQQLCLRGEDHPSDGVLVNGLLTSLHLPLCRNHRNAFLEAQPCAV